MRNDCLSPGRVNKAVVVSDDHPALLRARRRKERWSAEDARLYQRHRWRSEGFHARQSVGTDLLGRSGEVCRTCVFRRS